MDLPKAAGSIWENTMGIDLVIGVVAIVIGIALVRVIKGKDGELRFLRNSGLNITYPVVPLFFFIIAGASLILALT
jgi:hypothetical protein